MINISFRLFPFNLYLTLISGKVHFTKRCTRNSALKSLKTSATGKQSRADDRLTENLGLNVDGMRYNFR